MDRCLPNLEDSFPVSYGSKVFCAVCVFSQISCATGLF